MLLAQIVEKIKTLEMLPEILPSQNNMQNNNETSQNIVHFIGIGGIGMSALALALRQKNIAVQGSDLSKNYLSEKMENAKINYFLGHDSININNKVTLVVKTSIIKDSNPEIIEAKNLNIPIITRAELLGALMSEKIGITIAGTHGKTSTTAMISFIVEEAGLDPTFINGGILNNFASNQKIGKGKYFIAESDESDASFVNLPSKIGVVTNIEPEHLDFTGYNGSFAIQKQYYRRYLDQIPDDSICAICLDDKESQELAINCSNQEKIIGYSLDSTNKIAKITASNIKIDSQGSSFSVNFIDGRKIANIFMGIYGKHNVSNALAAIAIADYLSIDHQIIVKAFSKFLGVKRRFSKVGQYRGAVIIDDYGHHPTEIKTTLVTAKSICSGKLICVFEPHKFTRIRDLFNEFCHAFYSADIVLVSEIYSAGQSPIANISQETLVQGIMEAGNSKVLAFKNQDQLARLIKAIVEKDDIIFCTGAGNITYWAEQLQSQLENLDNANK
jgi:UDP-N-acetylmuramate--alanine ligase